MKTSEHKRLISDLWAALARRDWAEAVRSACAPDVEWHGFRPLRHASSVDELIDVVIGPWRRATPEFRIEPYVILAGEFEGSDWVAGTGDLCMTWSAPWLGFPAPRGPVTTRFGQFCRIVDGRVAEIRMLIDLPLLLRQAGVDLVPPSTGRDDGVPGPAAGDGVELSERDAADGRTTLVLVEEMIFGGLNKYDQVNQDSQGLERFWHDDMVWHGPLGLGTSRGLDEFKRNAQGPVVGAVPDRKGVGHRSRIAEGCFAASTGWPSLEGTHTAPFLGWPGSGGTTRWNIMDFWRRDGAKLRENWVLIDLIDVAHQAGVDLLGQGQ